MYSTTNKLYVENKKHIIYVQYNKQNVCNVQLAQTVCTLQKKLYVLYNK